MRSYYFIILLFISFSFGQDISPSGKIKANVIRNGNIVDSAIDSSKVKAGSITTSKLADSSVTSAKIATSTIAMNNLSVDIQNRIAGNKRINFKAYRTSEETVSASGDSTAWAAIEALLDDSTTAYFPAGYYNFATADISTINNDVFLLGEDKNKTVIFGDTTRDSDNYFGFQKSAAVENLTFKGFSNTLRLLNTNSPDTVDYWIVRNNIFEDGTNNAIFAYIAYDPTFSPPPDSTYMVKYVEFTNNEIRRMESGIYAKVNFTKASIGYNYIHDLTDSVADGGNIIKNTVAGVVFGPEAINIDNRNGDIDFIGNTITNLTSTVSGQDSSSLQGCQVYGRSLNWTGNTIQNFTCPQTNNNSLFNPRVQQFSASNGNFAEINKGVVWDMKGSSGIYNTFSNMSYRGTGEQPTTFAEIAESVNLSNIKIRSKMTNNVDNILVIDNGDGITNDEHPTLDNIEIIVNRGVGIKFKVDNNQNASTLKNSYIQTNDEPITMTGTSGKTLKRLNIENCTFRSDSVSFIRLQYITDWLNFKNNTLDFKVQTANSGLNIFSNVTAEVNIIDNDFYVRSGGTQAASCILINSVDNFINIQRNRYHIAGNVGIVNYFASELKRLDFSYNKMYGDTLEADTDGQFFRLGARILTDLTTSYNEFYGTDSIKMAYGIRAVGASVGGNYYAFGNVFNNKTTVAISLGGTLTGNANVMLNTFNNTSTQYSPFTISGQNIYGLNIGNSSHMIPLRFIYNGASDSVAATYFNGTAVDTTGFFAPK